VASGTDVILILCVYVGGVVVASVAWDLFFSPSISVSVPPHWLNVLLVWLILVMYLASGWRFAGRTLGKQMIGLRVARIDGTPLRFPRAFLRAALCVSFLPVLLLALVNRRNRGLEDVVFGTVVFYDWLPEERELNTREQMDSPIEIEVREVAVPMPALTRERARNE
jgi:uncharacterized RDD family membrane protein YckC